MFIDKQYIQKNIYEEP